MTYLEWAKRHTPARFELTVSGAPRVAVAECPAIADTLSTLVTGAYGDPVLTGLIADRYGVSPNSVLPASGTSSGNFVAMAVAAERGRKVAIEWPAYEPLLRVAAFQGLEVVRFRREVNDAFRPDLAEIAAALDRGVAAVVLSDFHNPSGRRCREEDMRAVADLCGHHGVKLIVDEVYRDFGYLRNGLPLGTAASLGDHVIATGSLTKVYGFGGLRAGWLLGSPSVIERARLVWDHLDVDLAAPSSSMAIQVLRNIGMFEDRTRRIREVGSAVYRGWIGKEARLGDCGDDGAIFGYVRLPDGVDSERFCAFLRAEFETQVVSGHFFEQRDHVRIGFGVPEVTLREGLRRISRALDEFPVDG